MSQLLGWTPMTGPLSVRSMGCLIATLLAITLDVAIHHGDVPLELTQDVDNLQKARWCILINIKI